IPKTKIKFLKRLPTSEEIDKVCPNLIVVDDLMTELNKRGIMRSLSLNAHYLILMKNPRDQSQIFPLAKQLCAGNTKRFIEAFQNATIKPFSYIKVDVTPQTPDHLRFQACLFPEENNGVFDPVYYKPK
ncbi:hypothetical protein B4U80_07984, partial [Leptotrombidium deliense]